MKLRNKKTGDAVYVDFQIPLSNNDRVLGSYSVTSLKALNESFEDYTPAEPLIKDEKIRKAVRAWADYNGVEEAFYFTNGEGGSRLEANYDIAIKFYNELTELKHWEKYTIAELCGEEEEWTKQLKTSTKQRRK